MSVDTPTNDATAVVVTFNCYRDISLKQATRTYRKDKRVPPTFHMSDKSSIDKVAIVQKN